MTYTDGEQFVDQNIWFPGSDLETLSSTGVEFCSSDDSSVPELYVAYLNLLYRYCAKERGIQKLSPNHFTNTTKSAAKFSKFQGYRGNVLSADNSGTYTVLTIAGLEEGVFDGYEIEIRSGAGAGQKAIITSSEQPVVLDAGVITAIGTNLSVSDSLKRRPINGFIGASCILYGNIAQEQRRKILYNDANTIYFYDVNYQQLECWNNNPLLAIAPYALPVATAGSAGHYRIESQGITLDRKWTTVPDATSSYVIRSRGLFIFGGLVAAPFSNFSFYDAISDTPTYKTAMGSQLLAAIGTDYTMEKIWDYVNYATAKAITSATARTVTISAEPTFTNNLWKNYELHIVGGTGAGQHKRIISNTTTKFWLDSAWTTIPDATSTYDIKSDVETIWMGGGTFSALFKYDYTRDMRSTSNFFDYGQCRNGGILYGGQEAYGITSIVRNTGGITVLDPTPTVAGSGYAVGDLFNITTGGTVGKGRVEAVAPGGAVTQVSLYSAGLTYTTGAGKATTVISGAGNAALTVNITTVGVVGRVTVASNVNLFKGDSVTLSGATEGLWNAVYSVLAIDSLTTFDVATTATATRVAANSQTTSIVVDATKNWTPGEWKNKLCMVVTAGYAGTPQIREITNNTATTITLASVITAGANGTSRYFIIDKKAFGKFQLWKDPTKSEYGFATGGSTTTLVCAGKNWNKNQWINHKRKALTGTGYDQGEIQIISNTENTLTFATQTFSPDATTEFEILDTYGTVTGGASTTGITDAAKNRPVGILQGLRIRFQSGTGQIQEAVITNNTATGITFPAVTVAPSTDTTYTILASNSSSFTGRGLGTELVWDYFNNNGKYMICFRGANSSFIDRYNISTEMFEIGKQNLFGQSELFTTGTQYVFDGRNRIFINPNGSQKIYYLDIAKRRIVPFTYLDMTQGTAIIGNRMEILGGPNGEQLLVMNRQSTTDCRSLLLPKYW